MSKRKRRVFTEEFKRVAVRLIDTSGRTNSQIADELGVGLSGSDVCSLQVSKKHLQKRELHLIIRAWLRT